MQSVKVLSILLLSTSSLIGCSSNEVNYSAPYCYTDESITMQGTNRVNSTTNLECTDRPGRQTEISRAGIDKGCEQFFYTEVRRGRVVEQRGVMCTHADGSREILDINGVVR